MRPSFSRHTSFYSTAIACVSLLAGLVMCENARSADKAASDVWPAWRTVAGTAEVFPHAAGSSVVLRPKSVAVSNFAYGDFEMLLAVQQSEGAKLELVADDEAALTVPIDGIGVWKISVSGSKAVVQHGDNEAKTSKIAEDFYGHIRLSSGPDTPLTLSEVEIRETGYTWLFNGEDMARWEGAGKPADTCWKVKDGILMCTGEKGPWIRSKETYGDFNLRLEYKVQPGANSGVYIRVPENGNHHGNDAGVEVQVLDDSASKYAKLKPYQYAAGVYDFAGATKKTGHKPGIWNTLEINVKGTRYTTYHNGVKVVDATPDEFPGLEKRRLEGYLGLQNHSTQVEFQNIRIGDAR